jgi:DNA-binding beta-propeller fold protein YncE
MRLVPLAFLVCALPLALGAAARADGCSPENCGTQSVALPGSRTLLVRPNGTQGPLVAYDLATGKRRFRLPPGMLSSNGRRFVATVPRNGPETTLARYDARSGRLLGALSLRSRGNLVAISSSGRFLVLQRWLRRASVLDVVDTARGAILRRARLGGSWSVETISKDGRRLYALQYLRDGYVVRLYDVAHGRLVPGSLRVKGEDGPMVGLAWRGLPSPDGRWLLTLFLASTGNEAAIHTLDLGSSSAVCIDLPSRGALQELQQYGLVLAPSGARAVAVNPVLGVVAVVDLASKKVVRTTSFPHVALPRSLSFTIAAASADGRTVYFGLRRSVWAYDAAYGKVRGPYRVGGIVAGLGFSPDGRRLWVVRVDRRVTALDAARGTPVRG